MLGKLIKYDLKATAKVFLLLHAVYLAVCIVSRPLFMDRLDFNGDQDLLIAQIIIFSSAMILVVVAANSGTWLIFTFRYYRNLFSREGYLTWTLPASGVQHLWAKILYGIILYIADMIIIAAGSIILLTGQNVTEAYSSIAEEFTEEFGMSIVTFGIYIFLFALASGVLAVVYSYFCVTVGQLFPAHRVIGAIAVYFITSFVIQIATLLILALTGGLTGSSLVEMSEAEDAAVSFYLFQGLWQGLFFMFIIAVVQYAATHYIMEKKINLL